MRFFITLSYCGTAYHGWQRQPHDTSVQEVLEGALSTVLRQPVAVTGAGRTDTGVNAAMMVAHFDCDIAIGQKVVHSLNGVLPHDIAVTSIVQVGDDAHARFDATSRTYRYLVHHAKSPFMHTHSWFCPHRLDYEMMNRAAARLLDYTDFTSFSKLHTDVKTNNCRIDKACWERQGDMWYFEITADRFLRNMVRAIVGTLVEVGLGKLTVDGFCRIIEQRNRCCAGTSMPGHALYLWEITYPYPIGTTPPKPF